MKKVLFFVVVIALSACAGKVSLQTCCNESASVEGDLQVVTTLVDKGCRQLQLGDVKAAIETLEEVERRFGEDALPELRKLVAKAAAQKERMLRQE